MKQNEAPERIYFGTQAFHPFYGLTRKWADEDIEYTRTDAFIEKACEWLKTNLQGVVGGSIYIDDFKKAMED